MALATKEEGLLCTIVEVDINSSSSRFSYRVCSICERTLPESDNNNISCSICNSRGGGGSKRLYRLLISVATAERVRAVVLFDRAARVLMGCSADQMFDLCRAHPSAAEAAADALRGEMCGMTLSEPKKTANAQHLRAVSVVPLRTGFSPVINTLNRIYHYHHHHRYAAATATSSLPPPN